VLLVWVAGVASAQPGSLEGIVVRVVDGDTIHVQLAVRLELDVQSRDRYGRLLAYVYVAVGAERPRGDQSDKYVMINADLLRLGYAQVMTIPPNVRYQSLFLKLQRDAREAGRGLWKGG